MVFLNHTTMQMTAKIVYYGPGLCGKTTNLQWIHAKTAPRSRGEMVSLETETDRTLFFDLLPLDVGVIGGMKVRLQLYTVPGQVFYNATRRLVLKGVDGVVFVADSQNVALEANLESLRNLHVNLAELGLGAEAVPIVFQYNKRDIRNILPVPELRRALNPEGAAEFEAAALHGVGVFETLKAVSRVGLAAIRQKVAEGTKPREVVAAGPAATPVTATAPTATATRVPAPASRSVNPLRAVAPDPATVREVEFAEEATDKHEVRPVQTLGNLDIAGELEKLRALAMSKPPRPAAASPEMDRLFHSLLISDKGTRQEVKRKAAVEVPAGALKGANRLRLHLAFGRGDGEELVEDVVVVKLVGDTERMDRLSLKLDLDLKAKP
jgi:mutual gliding-motility protein MglA